MHLYFVSYIDCQWASWWNSECWLFTIKTLHAQGFYLQLCLFDDKIQQLACLSSLKNAILSLCMSYGTALPSDLGNPNPKLSFLKTGHLSSPQTWGLEFLSNVTTSLIRQLGMFALMLYFMINIFCLLFYVYAAPKHMRKYVTHLNKYSFHQIPHFYLSPRLKIPQYHEISKSLV